MGPSSNRYYERHLNQKLSHQQYLTDPHNYYSDQTRSPWQTAASAGTIAGGSVLAGAFLTRTGLLRGVHRVAARAIAGIGTGPAATTFHAARDWSKRTDLPDILSGAMVRSNWYRPHRLLRESYDASASRLGTLRKDVATALAARGAPPTLEYTDLGLLLTQRRRIIDETAARWIRQYPEARVRGAAVLDELGSTLDDALGGALRVSLERQRHLMRTRGYRYATAQDVMRRLPEEHRYLIADAARRDPAGRWMDRIVDRSLFIDDADRLINMGPARHLALRGTKTAEGSFGLPWVGFNPLAMLYVSDIFRLRKPPILRSFVPGARQAHATGTITPQSHLVFATDRVLDLSEVGVREVARGGYLLSTRSFLASQHLRSMAGIEMATYEFPERGVRAAYSRLLRPLGLGFQDRGVRTIDDMALASAEMPLAKAAGQFWRVFRPYSGVTETHHRSVYGSGEQWLYVNKATLRDLPRQLFAGRHDLQGVSTATLPPYMLFARLNVGLSQIGLGLPTQDLGSAGSIFGNLLLKRMLPVVGGVEAWRYANYEAENIIGARPDRAFGDAYTSSTLALARAREALGVTDKFKRAAPLFPGSEHITELPLLGPPIKRLAMTEAELAHYWKHGEDPIRKGRFWPFGSTPFTGKNIIHYQPNWYRRMQSGWQYTDTLYGSQDEFFRHAPYPTPRYPAAPIRHFLTEPYHWERCVTEGTPIVLATGDIVPIEDVKIGDQVVTFTGQPSRVENKWSSKIAEDVVRITPALWGSYPVQSTVEHRYLAMKTDKCPHKGIKDGTYCIPNKTLVKCRSCSFRFSDHYQLQWLRADELKEGDYLAIPRPVLPETLTELSLPEPVSYWNGRGWTTGRQKALLNRSIPVSKTLFRLFGLYLAEGHVNRRCVVFSFASDEMSLCEEVASSVKSLFGLEVTIDAADNKLSVRIHHSRLAEWFGHLFNKGAANKRIPETLMSAPGYCLESLVGAWFQGDGTHKGGHISVYGTTISESLAHQLKHILLALGYIPTIQVVLANGQRKPNSAYMVGLHGPSGIRMRKLLGWPVTKQPEPPRWYWEDDLYIYVKIRQIEYLPYSGYIYDIKVEDNFSFMSVGAVLHNTHYRERPYLLTGTYPELEEFPLIGPLLGQISELFKPTRRMHPEVWQWIEAGVVPQTRGGPPQLVPTHVTLPPRMEENLRNIERRVFAAGGMQPVIPDDPGFPLQWGTRRVGAPWAWSAMAGAGGRDVVVAVLDTGVDATHPDLAGRVLPGYDVFTRSSQAPDDVGHGTHVAGIIAAMGNNREGVAGVAYPAVKILPVRVLHGGWGTSGSVAEGIRWATDWRGPRGERVSVINLSLGSPEPHAGTLIEGKAIEAATNAGILVVAAAGNEAQMHSGSPAIYPEALSVGSVAESEIDRRFGLRLSPFSNRGIGLDLTAPGSGILSTLPDGRYSTLSGTSMATPYVAGAAAILKSVRPDLEPDELRFVLQATAFDLGRPGADGLYGSGHLDIGLATVLTANMTPAQREAVRAAAAGERTRIEADRQALLNYIRLTYGRSLARGVNNLIVDEFGNRIVDPTTFGSRLLQTFENIREFGGLYGFMPDVAYSYDYRHTPKIATARNITSYRRRFWHTEIGGLGDSANEIARRFIGKKEYWADMYNPIPNKMPSWLPPSDYMVDIHHGDPYCLRGDVLVERGNLQFSRADTIQEGDILVSSSGDQTTVLATGIRPSESALSVRLATMSPFPVVCTLDHPFLVRRLVVGRNRKVRVKLFEYANILLTEVLKGHTRIEAIRGTGLDVSVASKCWKLLEEHNKIALTRKGQRAVVRVIDDSLFDMNQVSKGLLFVRAQDIQVGDYVAYPKPRLPELISTVDLAEISTWATVAADRVYAKNGHSWPRYLELTKDLGFFAGLWCAEGNAESGGAIRMAHHQDERDEVLSVYARLGLSPSWRLRPGKGADSMVGHKGIATFLLWLCGHGARNKALNDKFWEMPKDFIEAFIDGLFFGDGCQFTSRGRARKSLSTASKILALQVRKILLALGVVAGIVEEPPNGISGVSYDVNINGQNGSTQWFADDAYYYLRVAEVDEEPAVETYGFMTDSATFCAAGVITHNTKFSRGEIRLPGAAYESLYPDAVMSEFREHPLYDRTMRYAPWIRYEFYTPMARFRILADAFPWSDEYKHYSKTMSSMRLSEEERREVREIREQVRRRKEPVRLVPYRFRNLDRELASETVTVTRVVDAGNFFTEEYPENPIRLAGLYVSTAQANPTAQQADQYVREMLQPGARVTIRYSATEPVARDTYRTIRAAVTAGGTNLNQVLINRGWATEREDDFSPAAVAARFTSREIAVGKAWERFGHLNTPIHTKFLQVRSPFESWHRREVYGKDFQTWDDPISAYVVPTYQSWIMNSPPAALAIGVGAGMLFGRGRFGHMLGGAIGAAAFGGGALYRSVNEAVTGQRWVPPRRRVEWDIEEYFDILNYIKYRRLFFAEAQASLHQEGFDVLAYVRAQNREHGQRRTRIRTLEEAKQALYRSEAPDIDAMAAEYDLRLPEVEDETPEDRLKRLNKLINAELAALREKPEEPALPPRATRALGHYEHMRRTAYDWRPGDPLQDLLQALPKKQRRYFTDLAQAPGWEREKIAREVPFNMYRGLAFVWGKEVPGQPELAEYFRHRYLPGPEWAGWRPDVDLRDVKAKLVRHEGQDPYEFDVWPSDISRAELEPTPAPRYRRPAEQGKALERKIRDLLFGMGMRDVFIDTAPVPSGLEIDLDIDYDRRDDIVAYVNRHSWELL